MDLAPALRFRVDALRRGPKFSALWHRRPLGDDRIWQYLGVRLSVGLGHIPLRPLVLRRLPRLGVGTRLSVGARLGGLALEQQLLRLGTDVAGREGWRFVQYSAQLLGLCPETAPL